MTDYYSILRRAVETLDPNTAQARSELYKRARGLLADRTNVPASQLHAERAAFEAAIARIETELRQPELTPRQRPARQAAQPRPDARARGETLQLPAQSLGRPILLGIIAVAAALIVATGLYAVLTRNPPAVATREPPPGSQTASGPVAPATESPPSAAAPAAVAARAPAPASTAPTGPGAPGEELAPGTDGGSSEAGLPYYYRRQPVYYRTIHPVGTIIVDPSQRFLYLVQPKIMALRYGIGIGSECKGASALRRVTQKVEWPEWVPSSELAGRRSYPARMAGGPGNPLGARALVLDDAAAGIHGTNAPKSIGYTLMFGCYRMVNDDVIDLYQRVSPGTAVVVAN